MDDWRMTTEDRVGQVSWLNELAANLLDGPGNYDNPTAQDIVAYALSDEGRDSWGIELPEWFDAADRAYLVRRIEYCQSD